MWIPPHTTVPPFHHGAERGRHEGSDGREDDRRVERFRRRLARGARPLGAELAGERLAFHVSLSRECEDTPGLGAGDLGREVCRRAEPVDAEPLGVTRSDEATIADETGAEERGGMRVVVGRWKGKQKRVSATVYSA